MRIKLQNNKKEIQIQRKLYFCGNISKSIKLILNIQSELVHRIGYKKTKEGSVHMEPLEQITVVEAAKVMGRNPEFVRCGLQQGVFPFGFAVKMEKKWSYIIYKKKFLEWVLSGDEKSISQSK